MQQKVTNDEPHNFLCLFFSARIRQMTPNPKVIRCIIRDLTCTACSSSSNNSTAYIADLILQHRR